MASIKFKAGDEYLLKLSKLADKTIGEICGPAIHDAAGLVADSIRKELEKVPVDEGIGTADKPLAGPSRAQKKALYACYGITSMQEDETGFLNVKIGFDGYNDIKTQKWPDGQPNQLVARSVESGTSFMCKNPFVKAGVAASRKKAQKLIEQDVEKNIKKIMEG